MSDDSGSKAEQSKAERALSFGSQAEAYERARPSYPDAVVDWLVPGGARDVADVGAGTGKLTRLLLARGLYVTAVDPDAAMLGALSAASPGVPTRVGTAEHIPLDDDSVDLVTVAQAWHWVDPVPAVAEIARVLRPGGTLGLIWNIRDERDPWNQAFGDAAERSGAEMYLDRELELTAPFGPPEERWVDWSRTLDREGMLELVRSRSAWITRDERGRDEMLDDVGALLDANVESASRGLWSMPMRTVAFRARLAD